MRKFLDKMSELYYEGTPAISDAEFDLLADKHNYSKVGYVVTDAISHVYQMYSLQKCFDITKAPLDVTLVSLVLNWMEQQSLCCM